MRKISILGGVLLTVFSLLLALPLRGQRFEEVMARNGWNESQNRAGLRGDTLQYSYAEVWGGLQRGGYTNHSSSDESYTLGVKTESVRHFGRISYTGSFSYDHLTGRRMSGSMFTTPGLWPVDFYEYTPGTKIRERYAFDGALSADLGANWRVGLDVDFMAGNYAKRKDLRHKNTSLDLAVTPALQWRHDKWAIGANYRFEKHSERLEAEEIGSTPDSYRVFLNKGLYYGIETLWTSGDLHLDDSGVSAFPIRKTLHGAALQLQYDDLFAELGYRHQAGETGEKGSRWHEFDGDHLTGLLRWQHKGARGGLHIVRGSIDWRELQNSEVILSTSTTGGVTIATAYGTVPIAQERALKSEIAWEWLQAKGSHLEAGARYALTREQSSLLYPLLRGRSLRQWELFAEGRWALRRVELTLGIEYGWGSSAEWESMVGEQLPVSPYPARQTELYNWENEYLTAPRLGALAALRVHFGRGFYGDLTARYSHGFGLEFIPQPNRIEALLSLGYSWKHTDKKHGGHRHHKHHEKHLKHGNNRKHK